MPSCVQNIVNFCIGTGACYTGPRWQDVVTAWQYTSRNPTPYCDDCIEVQFNKLATGVSSINGAAWVDSNCNKVPAPARSCGEFRVVSEISPISLVWNEKTARTAAILSSFPLEPSIAGSYYIWRASADLPLLVYDPEHKGRISSPAQLFGTWTFGGKQAASLNGPSAAPWKNGFEALQTLDANADKKVSGPELAPLALWFDQNQNGKSEDGEVRSLEEAGVTAVYFTPDETDPLTADVHAAQGYERTVQGKTITGSAIDWFSRRFSSAQEAMLALTAEANVRKQDGQNTPAQTEPAPPLAQKSISPLDGAWLWSFDEKDQAGQPKGQGMLTFKQEQNKIAGHTYLEAVLSEPLGSAAKLLLMLPLKGKQTATSEADTSYSFTVIEDRNKAVTDTEFRWLKETDSLIGKSVTRAPLGDRGKTTATFSYTWTAVRFVPKSAP